MIITISQIKKKYLKRKEKKGEEKRNLHIIQLVRNWSEIQFHGRPIPKLVVFLQPLTLQLSPCQSLLEGEGGLWLLGLLGNSFSQEVEAKEHIV